MSTIQARIAVIGAGWWATTAQIPAVLEHPNAVLAALCDRDAEKLTTAAAAYEIITTYTDLQTMLDQEALDGAIIVTNHASHYAIAQRCLEHGLHIVVEKPFTLYAADAKALLDLAQAQGREIIIGYPYNYTAYAVRCREVLQSGELGAVQYVSAVFGSHIFDLLRGEHDVTGPVHGPGKVYSDPALSGGGMGHLQMTHPLGLLFFITELPIRRVHALMSSHGLAVDLVNAFAVEFENGALGSIGGTGNLGGGNGRKQDLQIYCEHGSIDIDICTGHCTIYRRDQEPEHVEPVVGERDYRRNAPAHNLIELILGQRPNESPAVVGWQVVELLDAAYRSAQQGGSAVDRQSLYEARSYSRLPNHQYQRTSDQ
ncbi:MAG TPA: Gfo/Idh/MocA family oxidoreductase [Caldilineaceae bacterium]|nr:Gfo/Idh/MocA family oxidoreductase [Caldilineaceae bacterium]